MAQPIKSKIQEAHPEVNIHPFLTLLIDGTNLLRISMADTKRNTSGYHIGGIFQFLLQVKMLLKKYDFDYVYVFFDDEYSGELRYRVYSEYKANRDKKYGEHVGISDYMKKYNDTLKNMQKYIFEKKAPKMEEGEPIKPKERRPSPWSMSSTKREGRLCRRRTAAWCACSCGRRKPAS